MSLFNDGQQKRELNQYWYSENTIKTLCEEIKLHGHKVAFISTPSLYFAFPESERKNFKLFEFDKKWVADPGFVFFDYNEPEKIPLGLWNSFDYVVVDPPFITQEVWAKYIDAVTTLGTRTPERDGVASQPAFKCLLTTVLENHSMLEDLLDAALFIPDFRPTVTGLVYQYSCFVNYNHVSDKPSEAYPEGRGVGKVNEEIETEDPKQKSARQMANDLRESEVEFLVQMRTRQRDGEQKLPTIARERELQAERKNKKNGAGGDDDHDADDNGDVNNQDITIIAAGTNYARPKLTDATPISEMKWGYVPEGLQMYKDGAAAPHDGTRTEEVAPETYGVIYVNAMKKRETLDVYKKLIDEAFKKLDAVTGAKDGSSQQGVAQQDLNDHRAKVAATLKAYAELCNSNDVAVAVAAADGDKKKDLSLLDLMKKFVDKLNDPNLLSAVGAVKDFAIDATRLYKSPAFNRQKELLQVLKVEKKKYNDSVVTSAAPGEMTEIAASS